jgi:hypothetical protein
MVEIFDSAPSRLLALLRRSTPTTFAHTPPVAFRPFMSDTQLWLEEQRCLAIMRQFDATIQYRTSPRPPMLDIVTDNFVENHTFRIFGLMR